MGFAIFGALYLIYFLHFAGNAADDSDPARAEEHQGGLDIEITAPLVSCPQCNSKNEHGYRFCRVCIGELPESNEEFPNTIASGKGFNP